MQNPATLPVFWGRPDTLLGICESLGRDLGFSPDILRVALAISLFLNPVGVILGYLGLGVLVLVTRLVAPVPRTKTDIAVPVAAPAAGDNDAETPELALAA